MAKVIDFLMDLSYLLGEDSVPTTGIDSRIGFINRVLEDIISRQKWSWNLGKTTVTLTGNSGALPADFRQGGIIYVKNQDGRYLSEVDERYVAQYPGNVFFIGGDYVNGHTITVNNDQDTVLTIEYAKRPPVFADLMSVLEFAIPIRIVVARGALIDVRRSENPFADVAPETAEYENEIRKLFRLERQSKGRRQVITAKAHSHGSRL